MEGPGPPFLWNSVSYPDDGYDVVGVGVKAAHKVERATRSHEIALEAIGAQRRPDRPLPRRRIPHLNTSRCLAGWTPPP